MTNQPLFDDEDLPAWLKAAGITYGGTVGTGLKSSGRATPAFKVPWAADLPPELRRKSSGPRGQVPWKTDMAAADYVQPEFEGVPWATDSANFQPEPSASDSGVESESSGLAWPSAYSYFSAPAAAPAQPEPGSDDEWMGILNESEAESVFAPESLPAETPVSLESLYLAPETPAGAESPFSDAEAFDATEQDWMNAFGEASPQAPVAPVPASDDDWMSAFPAPESAFPAELTAEPAADPSALESLESALLGEALPWDMPAEPLAAQPPDSSAEDDWMSAFGVPENEPASQTAEPAPLESLEASLLGEMLPWDVPEEPAPVQQPDVSAEDDWMSAFGMPDAALTAESEPLAPAEVDLDWLSEPVDPNLAAAVFEEAVQGEVTPAADDVFPDFDLPLDDLLPAESAAAPAASPSAEDDIPDFFRFDADLEGVAADFSPAAPSTQAVPESDLLATDADLLAEWDVPDSSPAAPDSWLTEKNRLPETPPAPMPDMPEPDWLHEAESDLVTPYVDVTEELAAAAPSEAEVEAADMPEWMRGMAPVQAAPVAASRPAADDLPFDQMDWLQGMELPGAEAAAFPEAGPVASGVTPAPKSEEDAMFASMFGDEASPELPGMPAAEPASGGLDFADLNLDMDIDQLLNLPSSGILESETAAQSTPSAAQDVDFGESLDDILAALPASKPSRPAPPIPAAPAVETVILPQDTFPPEMFASETPAEAPAAKTPTPAPAKPPSKRAPKAATSPAPSQEAPAQAVPEWVSEMRAAPVVLRIADQQVKLEDKPAAELDDQLRQFRDRQKLLTGKPVTSAPPPAGGPLSGITDAIFPLPVDPATMTGAGSEQHTETAVSGAQARRIETLQKLLSVQEKLIADRIDVDGLALVGLEGKPAITHRRLRSRPKVDRLLITLLLAVAVIVPFFTDLVNLGRTPSLADMPADQRSAVQAAFDAVDSVQAGSAVLVAFEYNPTGAGEMDDLALALLRDLLGKRAIPVIVSTNPAAVIHARGMLLRLANDPDDRALIQARAGAPYEGGLIPAGYLPGDALGVRALISALQGDPLWKQIVFGANGEGALRTPEAADALIRQMGQSPTFLLAETTETVRLWAEQYRVGTETGAPAKVVLMTSAGAGASGRVYANPNMIGPLVGLRDALIYQAERKLFPSAAAERRAYQRWQSQTLAGTAAALIILFGAALGMIRDLPRRRTADRRQGKV